jgi:hypothetical protein
MRLLAQAASSLDERPCQSTDCWWSSRRRIEMKTKSWAFEGALLSHDSSFESLAPEDGIGKTQSHN